MKKKLLIFFLIIPYLISAQSQSTKKNAINVVTGIGVGSGVSEFYGQRLTNPFVNQGQFNKEYPKTIAFAVNYRFGVDYQRFLIKRLSLKAGLRIASWNLRSTDYFGETSLLQNVYLEIPLGVQYSFNDKKIRPYIAGGLSALFNLIYNDNSHDFSWAASAGIGLSYQVFNNIRIYAELSGRAHIMPSVRYVAHDQSLYAFETGRAVFPYEIGLEIGGTYSF